MKARRSKGRDEDSETVPLAPGDEATRFDPGMSRLTLHGTRGPLKGRQFRMTGVVFNLGREAGSDVIIPGDGVSRRHAQIHLRSGRFMLTDQGTLNGTRVNGRLVVEPVAIEAGDRIHIGRTELAVAFGDETVPPPRRRGFLGLDKPWGSPWAVAVAGMVGAALMGGVVCLATSRKAPPQVPEPEPPPRVESRASPPPRPAPIEASPAPHPSPELRVPEPRTAAAILQARNLRAVSADGEGTVRDLMPVGSAVSAQQKMLEYQAPAAELAKKRAHLKALKQKYGSRPEYADFIDEARAEVTQAGAPRGLRSPVTGVIIDEKVRAGDHIQRGMEVARVAADVELLLEASVVQGAGATCKVYFPDRGATTVEGRLSPRGAEPGRRVIGLSSFPPGLALGDVGAARAECH